MKKQKIDKYELVHALQYAIDALKLDMPQDCGAEWEEAMRRIQIIHDRLLFGRLYKSKKKSKGGK